MYYGFCYGDFGFHLMFLVLLMHFALMSYGPLAKPIH